MNERNQYLLNMQEISKAFPGVQALDFVNLETDILGKYVAKQLGKETKGVTEEFLKEHGF